MADNTPNDPQADALLREVDEQVRHDQMVALWKRYGSFVITGAVLIVLTTAGFQGWKVWKSSQREADAVTYEMAIDKAVDGDLPAAAKALDALHASAATGYGAVAALQRAAILLEEGKTAEAVAAYKALADDTSLETELRNLASVLYALNGLNQDGADLAALESAVAPLAVPGNAYRHSAFEVQALIAMERGDNTSALALFQQLATDATAPQGIRGRAVNMVTALGGTLRDVSVPTAGQ